jgi:hypothetical protein
MTVAVAVFLGATMGAVSTGEGGGAFGGWTQLSIINARRMSPAVLQQKYPTDAGYFLLEFLEIVTRFP